MSDILRAAERYKKRLVKQNDRALKQLIRAYDKSWKRLDGEFKRLSKKITDAQTAQEEYSINWIFRQERYQRLMQQLEVEVKNYSKMLVDATTNQQKLALGAGLSHSEHLVKASLQKRRIGMLVTWNRAPKEAVVNLAGFLSDGSPLSYKFQGLSTTVANGIKDTMTAGLAQGWNPRKMAAEIKREYQGQMQNTLLTCRTETMRAYNLAAHESFKANSDVVKGWIRAAARNGRTCAACLAQDGTFHEVDEPLIDHPGGRCVQLPVTRTFEELAGKPSSGIKETSAKPWNSEDTFKKLPEDTQRKILGPTVHELYKAGKIGISDMATLHRSSVWGDHYRPTTIQELLANGKITVEDLKAAQAAAILERRRLPGFDEAIIPKEKFTKYALDLTHDVGKHKAVVFQSALGYNQSNADDLIDAIRRNLGSYPARSRGRTQYGRQYEVVMNITGPNGNTANVLTGWILAPGENRPKMTSVRVLTKKRK